MQLQPEVQAIEEDARMTSEQLKELAEALSILSAQSSVMKERAELRALMEENLNTEEVCAFPHGRWIARAINFLGSKITHYTSCKADPHNAYKDRRADVGIRRACWLLFANDFLRPTGKNFC